MPSEKDDILELNQYMKSDKIPYIIYVDMESLTENIDGCANNSENYSTMEIGNHIPCRYLTSTFWSFNNVGNFIPPKRLYKKVLWMFKRICQKITDFEKKNMLPLTTKKN